MRSRVFGFMVIVLMISTLALSQATEFDPEIKATLEPGSQMMDLNIGKDNVTHMVYLVGTESKKITYPTGGIVFNSELYQFKYGQIVNGVFTSENVTDKPVYRFFYDFVVDSSNNVHTVFIAENYTMYYAVRSSAGVWTYEALNQPDQWFALSPSIILGENEYPRIVFSAILRENAGQYWYPEGNVPNIVSRHATYYQYWNGTAWNIFDITNNHGFIGKDINRLDTYNPGIAIQDGIVFASYTSRVSQSGESRLTYAYFPEDPTTLGRSIDEQTFARVYASTPVSILYSRPTILLDSKGGIFIAVGLLTKNAALVVYSDNKFKAPDSSINEQKTQWSFKVLDSRLTPEVVSIDGVLFEDRAILTWSLRDSFDTINGHFTHDIFLGDIAISNGKIDESKSFVTGVTNSEDISHYSPNIFLQDGEYKIYYLEVNGGESTLQTVQIRPRVSAAGGAIVAFFLVLVLMALLIYVWRIVVRHLPDPKVEEEILPHMINLKDSIARDE